MPMTMAARICLALLLGAGALHPRQAGAIRGTVSLPSATAVDRPAPGALSGAHHDPPERRAVVYLDAVPRRAFEDIRPARVRMDQRGEQFAPRVLAVTAGTVVEFPNSDTTFHNVFSLSRVKTFDLGRYRPGRTGAVTFDRPGIVPIFCDIHAHMSAYVLVFSHPYFAVTAADGGYTIGNVPPGTYTVLVWSELGTAAARRVSVSDGVVAEADFHIGRER
jgi:plastocyanin